MRPRLIALAAALVVLAPAVSARAQQPVLDRAAIEKIVHEYLLKNPEIIQEAAMELDRRHKEEERTAQRQAVETQRKVLLGPRGITVGNPAGDTAIVEFFDYNCSYCKRALGDMRALIKADPKLKVVLRDFPVLGPESLEASRVALAARQQLQGERLLEYHVRLMETRGRVNGERALAVAKEMGLDTARIEKAMEGDEVRATLAENAELGDKLGLTGTPAFVIGNEVISGAVGLEPMRRAVASVRQCGKAAC
jgi:protein-disulfide isomerase